jgi:hypothetical protein
MVEVTVLHRVPVAAAPEAVATIIGRLQQGEHGYG